MRFRIAVDKKRRYVQGVVTCLVALAGMAGKGKAQDSTMSSVGFRVGDRIILTVEQPQSIQDTLVVRDGLIVRIKDMGDIPLKGVRRKDIEPYLTQQVGRFLQKPVVHAVPLINIGIAGNVVRPGFYPVLPDAILSDVVMQAGGPSLDADLNKTVIQRGGKVLYDEKQTNLGMRRGSTLEDLQLISGDQIMVGEKSHNLNTVMQVSGLLLGVAGIAITLLLRR